jgi:hypothetical protein
MAHADDTTGYEVLDSDVPPTVASFHGARRAVEGDLGLVRLAETGRRAAPLGDRGGGRDVTV